MYDLISPGILYVGGTKSLSMQSSPVHYHLHIIAPVHKDIGFLFYTVYGGGITTLLASCYDQNYIWKRGKLSPCLNFNTSGIFTIYILQ